MSGTGVVAGERPGRARPAPAQSRDKAAQKRWRRISHLGLWALTLTPAVVTLVDTFTWNLGVDPIETLTHRTGWWAIVHLAATLAVTPLRRLFGWHWLVRYRRQLGLGSFIYASLHLGVYAFLDLGLDFSHLAEDIIERPFITVGFTSWLILLALALTSTTASMRRLGKRWTTLHRLVYIAAGLVSLHYIWGQKVLETQPLFFAVLFAVLLASRVFYSWRKRRSRAGRGPVSGRAVVEPRS
ncbi:MAG TPA: protein-methionine-sulfoxide reductase heme-binding subunit MsrQ [Trueperaceae bacterium]